MGGSGSEKGVMPFPVLSQTLVISISFNCVPLGHEYPFAIQMYHNRHRHEFSEKIFQLQFIVKRKEPAQLMGKWGSVGGN